MDTTAGFDLFSFIIQTNPDIWLAITQTNNAIIIKPIYKADNKLVTVMREPYPSN
jgi:nitrate reductase NapAB chaperone NapD